MFDLFKKKTPVNSEENNPATTPQSTEYRTAPGTEIRFSPTLIDDLKHDHKQLFNLYMAIKASFDKGDYAAVSQLLNEFRFGLHNHLLTENVRLYIYLGRMLESDEAKAAMIRSFRHEMEGIGKTALRLLKKYEDIAMDKELATPFATDFATIGTVLTERIKKEEGMLYPLYMAD